MADAGLAVTRLTTPGVDATAAAVKTAIEKLAYLRNMDAPGLTCRCCRPSVSGSWPRSAAALPVRRCSAGTAIAGTPRDPEPDAREVAPHLAILNRNGRSKRLQHQVY